MTLSPDADKAQVRQAVIELQNDVLQLAKTQIEVGRTIGEAIDSVGNRLEEAERRIELLSVALKSTLTSREVSSPVPRPTPASPAYSSSALPERDWRPIGDGQKYWANQEGYSTPVEQVPGEVMERWKREKGTPIPEYEEGV